MLRKHNPSFSTVFFNAGAHIQHHYLYSSGYLNAVFGESAKPANSNYHEVVEQDPFEDVILAYDRILRDYLKDAGSEVVVATGLTQIPYPRCSYYYRLDNHVEFLSSLNLKFKTVEPRMSRDFSIFFESTSDMLMTQQFLNNACVIPSGESVFDASVNGELQLFVTLTYPHEITRDTFFSSGDARFSLWDKVSLVAIKNGMHSGKGFLYQSRGLSDANTEQATPVWNIFQTINSYFSEPNLDNQGRVNL